MHIHCNRALPVLILLLAGFSVIEAAAASSGFVLADSTLTIEMGGGAANSTSQVLIKVQPSLSAIDAGAFAKFEIRIVSNRVANVFLATRGIPTDSVAIFTPNVGVANPDFNSSLTIVTSADTPQSDYNVTAVAIINGIEYTSPIILQILASGIVTTTANTPINISLSTALSMSINTDQPQYQSNSTVMIQGQVTDATGSAVPGAAVVLQVDAPTGKELLYATDIETDSAGTFQAQVTVEANSPTGTYTVFASANKPGYSTVTTRTTFVVGSSTTPSVIIKAVYAGDSDGNPMSTFTSGQTIWIWVVIESIGNAFQGVLWIQVRDPNGVPVQIQTQIAQLKADQTVKEGLSFTLPAQPTVGVYTVNALVSDKLISQGGAFLASSETKFALIG